MAHSFPQFGEIERKDLIPLRVEMVAREIRRVCGQGRTLKFDPEACARFFGVAFREVDLPSEMSGQMSLSEHGPLIEIRKADPEPRKRFSLCHEIGHLCFLSNKPGLPFERYRSYFAKEVYSSEEKLCDRIAAELLMPERTFRIRARSQEPRGNSCSGPKVRAAIEALKIDYGCSFEQVLRRICSVRAWSVGVAAWKLPASESNRRAVQVGVARRIRAGSVRSSYLHRITDSISMLEKLCWRDSIREMLSEGRVWEAEKDDSYFQLRPSLGGKRVLSLVVIADR
jgi:Zn-dependent peptidase ImmA (M78 family)